MFEFIKNLFKKSPLTEFEKVVRLLKKSSESLNLEGSFQIKETGEILRVKDFISVRAMNNSLKMKNIFTNTVIHFKVYRYLFSNCNVEQPIGLFVTSYSYESDFIDTWMGIIVGHFSINDYKKKATALYKTISGYHKNERKLDMTLSEFRKNLKNYVLDYEKSDNQQHYVCLTTDDDNVMKVTFMPTNQLYGIAKYISFRN